MKTSAKHFGPAVGP